MYSNNAIDMAYQRIAVADFYCSFVCCSGQDCFACFVGLLLCAAVCSVAVSFRSIVNAKCLPTLPAATLVATVPLQSLIHVRVQVLLYLFTCCDSSVSVALVFGVGLLFALSSVCSSAVLVVLLG